MVSTDGSRHKTKEYPIRSQATRRRRPSPGATPPSLCRFGQKSRPDPASTSSFSILSHGIGLAFPNRRRLELTRRDEMAISGVGGLSEGVAALGQTRGPGCLRCPLEGVAGRNYCGAVANLTPPPVCVNTVVVPFTDGLSFTRLA